MLFEVEAVHWLQPRSLLTISSTLNAYVDRTELTSSECLSNSRSSMKQKNKPSSYSISVSIVAHKRRDGCAFYLCLEQCRSQILPSCGFCFAQSEF